MQYRDLLKDQIEQLNKVLAKILGHFLGLKSAGKIAQGIEVANEQFRSEVDLDIDKIISLSGEELKAYLKARKLRAEHLETLSTYVREIGESKSDKQVLRKAIELLDIADETSKTASYSRIEMKKKIEDRLL